MYPHEFEMYSKACLDIMIANDDRTVICPNKMKRCTNAITMPWFKPPEVLPTITLKTDRGKVLSKEAWLHYKEFRLRCRECQFIFCGKCKKKSYHMG